MFASIYNYSFSYFNYNKYKIEVPYCLLHTVHRLDRWSLLIRIVGLQNSA
jgi:hypothetical protein